MTAFRPDPGSGWRRRIRRAATPPTVMRKRDTVETAAARHGVRLGRILNVGSKDVRMAPDSVNLDLVAGPGVDVVGDAHRLGAYFPPESFNTVVLVAVLQYCKDPARVIAEAAGVLKPGGHLFVDAPFLQPYCEDQPDLWRFSAAGLAALCRPHFDIVEINPSIASGPALAYAIQTASRQGRNRWIAALRGWVVTIAILPLRWITGGESVCAGAHLLVGRKPGPR